MNLGFPEMLFLFILALIIFGPKRLPEIGRQIGKGLAEFKRASNEFQSQIQEEVRRLELEADIKNTIAPVSLQNTVSYSPSSPAVSAPDAPQVIDGNEIASHPNGTEKSAETGSSANA